MNNLNHIFAVTILIDAQHEHLFHFETKDGLAPTEHDITPSILPFIRQRVHPGSTFEIVDVISVADSMATLDGYVRN